MKKLMILMVMFASGCGCDFWSNGVCVQLHERMEDWNNIESRIDYITETANWYCGDGGYLDGSHSYWTMKFKYGEVSCPDLNPFNAPLGGTVLGCANSVTRTITIKLYGDGNQCIERTSMVHEICHAWGKDHDDAEYKNLCSLWPDLISQDVACSLPKQYEAGINNLFCEWDY